MIVDYTWRYVNKSGGPDKKFKDNPKISVMLYSDIRFTSSNGLNELMEFSKADAGKSLNSLLSAYSRKKFLMEVISETPATA